MISLSCASFLKIPKRSELVGRYFDMLVLIRIIPDFVERGADKKFREEKRAIRGAQAEEKVGDILADLSTDFYVLHEY